MHAKVRPLVLALAFALPAGALQAQNPAVTVQVDAAADRRPIDPRIYGVAHAGQAELLDLNVPLNRWGGNNTSRYNWLENADNRGQDWFFQSVPLEGGATPGAAADLFIGASRNGRAEPMMTIPMVGWVGRLGPNRDKLASFRASVYGAQAACDWQWFPDACNGVRPDGVTLVTGNDPNEANTPADALFQRGWAQHMVQQWQPSYRGGLRHYILDNEHSIWFSTHRDVHPVGATMEEVRDKMKDYAARIRQADPTAVISGPEEWGWTGYLYSGFDMQWLDEHGWGQVPPDRAAHGNQDYMPWLLAQLYQHQQQTGQRTLDVFTLHYYPQGGEFGNDVSSAMQQRRNRSTRSLWDPAYVDETWIAASVRLVPRMKQWVAQNYPGLQVGVTEYNWGAENHINGATAQADVLGIFGREGLDLAARWTTPAASSHAYKAIKLYRNYDGARSTFGDVSVRAGVPNPDQVAAFAARRAHDGALTVMVISKHLSGSTPVTVNLANFQAGGPADAWQLTSANAITHLAPVAVSGSSFTLSVPSPSVTLFVVPPAVPVRPRGDFNRDGQADLLWHDPSTGQLALSYMAGSRQTASTVLAATEPDPNWRVVGTHDFSLDGRTDILWRHALTGALRIWAMDDAVKLNETPLTPAALPDLGWRVVATGDFNADGKPDIVWRHATSGRNVVWLMNGTTRLSGVFTTPDTVADLNWLIAGSGDFDADGRPDLIWRQALSGNVVVWLMNGTTRVTGAFIDPPSLADPNWQLAAVGDFSQDGQPDVLWRHASSARTVLWEMDGLGRGFGLYTTPDVLRGAQWSLVGPR
jgi:hypothetical protein